LRGKVEAGKPQARSPEDRSKNAASSSNEKVKSNSAAVNSQTAVI